MKFVTQAGSASGENDEALHEQIPWGASKAFAFRYDGARRYGPKEEP